MPDHTERYVKIYDMTISPARVRGAPPCACRPADFDRLRRAVKAAAASSTGPLSDEEDDRGRKLYLMDMEIRGQSDSIEFVWTLADPNAAAQMYLNRAARTLRAAPKLDDEDVASSAHMVVDLASPGGSLRYRTALEDHDGISRGRVKDLLEYLLRSYMPTVTAVLDDGVTKTNPPRVNLDAHPGRLVRQTSAAPVEIDVVKLTPRRAMVAHGMDPYYESVDRHVFRLGREGPAREMQDLMLAKVRELRHQYPDHRIRIRWRDPERKLPDDVTQIDPLDDRPERLLERALTRTILLDHFRGLPDATSTIVERLTARMLTALREVAAEEARGARPT